MKNLLLFFFLLNTIAAGICQTGHVSVKGYFKQNGTFVKPHMRTAPNSTNQDNFSTIQDKHEYEAYLFFLGYSKSKASIKKFQRDHGLVEDGVIGERTLEILHRAVWKKHVNNQSK